MGVEMSRLDKSQWVAVFRAARAVLTTKGWVQGAFAKNASGRACPIPDPDACRFCLSGAVGRALSDQGLLWLGWRGDSDILLEQFIPEPDATRGYDTIPTFNDQATFEDVLALLDNAIKILEKEVENESSHE